MFALFRSWAFTSDDWDTKAMDMPLSPQGTVQLMHALSIYHFEFLSPHTLLWVEHCFRSPAMMLDMETNSRIIAFEDTNDGLLHQSVTFRSPVYFGKHVTSAFDETTMQCVFGYGLPHVDLQTRARFTLLAPNYAPNYRGSGVRFFTVHVMGVNFESPASADYRCFAPGGRLRHGPYEAEVFGIFKMIREAVDDAYSAGGPSGTRRAAPRLRLPAFGMGAYLSALPSRHHAFCQAVFMRGLIALAASRPSWSVELCLYPSLQMWASEHALPANLEVLSANLFDVGELGEHVFLVNAWDTVSFVGNGGTRDFTVDGMMVSGVGGGEMLINCSYLHNPFFRTRPFDASRTRRVARGPWGQAAEELLESAVAGAAAGPA